MLNCVRRGWVKPPSQDATTSWPLTVAHFSLLSHMVFVVFEVFRELYLYCFPLILSFPFTLFFFTFFSPPTLSQCVMQNSGELFLFLHFSAGGVFHSSVTFTIFVNTILYPQANIPLFSNSLWRNAPIPFFQFWDFFCTTCNEVQYRSSPKCINKVILQI